MSKKSFTFTEPHKIILEGVVGSQAYGLATPESDVDMKGVFIVPLRSILSMKWNKDRETIDAHEPDVTYHEVGKFIKLALAANPTILELLFLNEYTTMTHEGEALVEARNLFLSNQVRKSYGGYAISQIERLKKRGDFGPGMKNRYAKHARHCFRLLLQGQQLLTTGSLRVRVDEETREFLFKLGESDVDTLCELFEEEYAKLEAVESVLPDEPEFQVIDDLLYRMRLDSYGIR